MDAGGTDKDLRGDGRESNPPGQRRFGLTGFEDRGAHQDTYASIA